MLAADSSLPGEVALLLACARVSQYADRDVIHRSLDSGIDFTAFTRKAISHGLAGLAGHTLTHVAPGLIQGDIAAAFPPVVDRVRRNNERLVAELVRVLDALAAKNIDAIPIKGPVLALKGYGDLGLREFRDLDFL